ncbi:molybdate transport system permease protein [Nocardioides zeae]|uniref:Molybdate transport system permease protein n=1 Tax=Nocardioides zeae TaxID=1457234 RepID=A0ACC6IDK4_9ACTN|nr:ABC transporter permease [Nocardioides zeae]MDR6175816.1 molybdate transport system permease protein [Nocardioides zeae]MDR6208744.1 molybdate transport system permease protein [Nocardioides zeae]
MTARSPLGRAPALLWVPALVAVVFLVVPLVALVLATPWGSFLDDLRTPEVRAALWLSLRTSLATVVACALVGTPLAWVLARVEFRGRGLVRALVTVPLVLPPVVAGVALLAALGRSGLLGAPLRDATGVTLPYTTAAVVLAHTFVALPFFVISVEGALRSAGEAYDEAAAVLGATRWHTFRHVTLPLALPGVVAGGVLAWARSLGEFGATVTFAGNYPGTTQTMPSRIYAVYLDDPAAARTLAMILLLASVGVLLLLRNRWLTPGAAA